MHEITLPDTKPALEWVNNRVLRKVSPKRKHALAQMEFGIALGMWARGRGMAGPEWCFQVQPPGEISRTLVPDIAFLSYDRVPVEELEATEVSRIAPDVVVEIRSPDDRQRDIDEKVRVYLAAGTGVIFLVDPKKKMVEAIDSQGTRTFTDHDVVEHGAMPGFSLTARLLFELQT